MAIGVLAVVTLAACGSSTVSSSGATAGSTSDTATGADFSMRTKVTCTPAHEQQVTWFVDNTGPELEVVSAKVDGVTTADPVFSPAPVPEGATTSATITVAGSLQGDIDLHLTLSFGSPVTTGGTTALKGNC